MKSKKTNTSIFNYINLGEKDYFPMDSFPKIEQKMRIVNQLSDTKSSKDIYGVFSNFDEYLSSLNMLMASTYETEHRNYIIYKEVITAQKLRYAGSFLDIGVGNGDLTKFLGIFFANITLVDLEKTALDNIPDNFGIYNHSVIKIHGSILDNHLEIYQKKYDFILLSHVLYYIQKDKIIPLIQNLYELLSPSGYMLVIYNAGGDRADLLKYFNQSYQDIDCFGIGYSYNFASCTIYVSQEYLTADNPKSMMHILDVCLNDGKTQVNQDELARYLQDEYFDNDTYYQVGMQQNIMLIGNSNGY